MCVWVLTRVAATPTETPAVHAHVLRFLAEPRGCAARGDLRHGRHWCRTAALLPGQMSVRTEAVAADPGKRGSGRSEVSVTGWLTLGALSRPRGAAPRA